MLHFFVVLILMQLYVMQL